LKMLPILFGAPYSGSPVTRGEGLQKKPEPHFNCRTTLQLLKVLVKIQGATSYFSEPFLGQRMVAPRDQPAAPPPPTATQLAAPPAAPTPPRPAAPPPAVPPPRPRPGHMIDGQLVANGAVAVPMPQRGCAASPLRERRPTDRTDTRLSICPEVILDARNCRAGVVCFFSAAEVHIVLNLYRIPTY